MPGGSRDLPVLVHHILNVLIIKRIDVQVRTEIYFEWFRVSVFLSIMGRSPGVAPKVNIREFGRIIGKTLDIIPNQNFK